MSRKKSKKRAILLLLLLIFLGVSTTYLGLNYFGDSDETTSVIEPLPSQENETVASVEKVNLVENKQVDTTKEEPEVLTSTNESLSVDADQMDAVELDVENSEQPMERAVVEVKVKETIEEEKIEIVEKIEVKSVEELVETTTKLEVSSDKVEEVFIDESLFDPFNLFISAELDESDILNKYDYGLYINAFNRSNGKVAEGEVQVYDKIRSKKIKTMNTQTVEGINDPNNRTQEVRLISSIFGYKPQEVSFSLNDPANFKTDTQSTVRTLSSNIIRIDLSLERLQVGDIAVLWNVFFYKDAAIIQPKSKPQLQDLLTMMKENPAMKIKLHGHANGNSHGKVIHLGEKDNNDLFNLDSPNHVETVGSSQKLSLYRAETIQHYLMTNGIEESRIEIKGWGGKKMIEDKHSSQANLNVRVEVEILQN